MKKVWKWIQDKGLDDKISLQDAYDLAKDMRDDINKEKDTSKDSTMNKWPPINGRDSPRDMDSDVPVTGWFVSPNTSSWNC